VLFAESLEKIGQRIEQAQDSYDKARRRLTDGRGNLLRQIEMLRELGAENSKDLPEEMEEDLAQADLPEGELTEGELTEDEIPEGQTCEDGEPGSGSRSEEMP
jgi:DNA recombination protein RmuC